MRHDLHDPVRGVFRRAPPRSARSEGGTEGFDGLEKNSYLINRNGFSGQTELCDRSVGIVFFLTVLSVFDASRQTDISRRGRFPLSAISFVFVECYGLTSSSFDPAAAAARVHKVYSNKRKTKTRAS